LSSRAGSRASSIRRLRTTRFPSVPSPTGSRRRALPPRGGGIEGRKSNLRPLFRLAVLPEQATGEGSAVPPRERRPYITAAPWLLMTHMCLLAERVLWCGVLSSKVLGPQLAAPRVRHHRRACGALGDIPIPFLESSLARLNCQPATSRLPSELLPDCAPSLTGRSDPTAAGPLTSRLLTGLSRSATALRSSSHISGKSAPAKAGGSSEVIGTSYAETKAPGLMGRQGRSRYGCSTR
jgi:hypothetical protein